MLRQALPTQVRALGEREVEVILSTDQRGRDGHILEPAGAVLDRYQQNPIVLWMHQQTSPVGRASDLVRYSNRIAARIAFAPAGISAIADEACNLVKCGIVSTVSVGFDIIESTPIDAKQGRYGGQHVTRWELLECSLVSVPADTGAVVVARNYRRRAAESALHDELREHVDAASQHLDDAARAHDQGDDRGVERAHRNCRRSLRAAQRTLRDLAEAAAQMDLDASKTIQGAGGGIGTAIDQGSSPPKPPRLLSTYQPGESPAHLVARIREADYRQRLDHLAAIPSYGGSLSVVERRAAVERLRRPH
jgi:HK97 family phage prohead protease